MIDRGASVTPKILSKDIECYKSALEIINDYKTGNWVVNSRGNEDIEKLKEEFAKIKKLRKRDLWKSGGCTIYGRKKG